MSILDFDKAREVSAIKRTERDTVYEWLTADYEEELERQAQAAVQVALEKYGRHIEGVCDISVDTSYPRDSRCTCGLRELVEAK